MSNISKDNYLDELFIDEAKGALNKNGGDNSENGGGASLYEHNIKITGAVETKELAGTASLTITMRLYTASEDPIADYDSWFDTVRPTDRSEYTACAGMIEGGTAEGDVYKYLVTGLSTSRISVMNLKTTNVYFTGLSDLTDRSTTQTAPLNSSHGFYDIVHKVL